MQLSMLQVNTEGCFQISVIKKKDPCILETDYSIQTILFRLSCIKHRSSASTLE